jgi:hypothetical protein
LMTEEMAFLQSSVVQITQIDRLFNLVNIFASKENKRHLGLDQVYLLWFMGIGLGFKKGFNRRW